MAIAERLLEEPKAPNACPDCGHTPKWADRCFGAGPTCLDWRGRQVMCLCVHDVHFTSEVSR